MRTRLVLAAVPLALLGTAVATSAAAGKPVQESYTATAPVPAGYAACDPTLMSAQADDFKVPGAGTLKVDLGGFAGDWDLFLLQGETELVASQEIQPLTEGETVTAKFKKATTVTVLACNYNGGPTGTVDLLFTPA